MGLAILVSPGHKEGSKCRPFPMGFYTTFKKNVMSGKSNNEEREGFGTFYKT
nr:hypothetical protein Iba_chr02fCG2500 [Ipomoea batatas]